MNYSKIKYFFLTLLLVSFASFSLKAQFAESIATGRPGQANGPFAVGKKIYQIQTGFDYISTTTTDKDFERENIITAQNAVFRFGVKEDFELRASYNYNIQDRIEQKDLDLSSETEGISGLNFGFRQYLFDQKGLLPAFGVQFTAQAGGFEEYKRENFNSELKLIANHRIAEGVGLNTNLAFNWQTDQAETVAPYIVSLDVRLNNNLSVTVETYGTIEKYDNSIFFGAGLGYLLNENFQLDVYSSYGDNKNGEFGSKTETFYLSAGISYRLNRRN